MPTHDCETCESSGSCPMESIAPWLNEHEEEAKQAGGECAPNMAIACEALQRSVPIPGMLKLESVVIFTQIIFQIGYQKGRTYQDVPQVFKDSL